MPTLTRCRYTTYIVNAHFKKYVAMYACPNVMSPELKYVHKVEYNYQFHNTLSLSELNSCKYLGFTIQLDLKWSQHIHQIAVKANVKLYFIT